LEEKAEVLIALRGVGLVDEEEGLLLEEIDFEVKEGDRKFILGQPHLPAVHLLRVCATQYPPTSGTVSAFGKVTNEMGFRELLLIKRHIGFVERISSLISNITLLENITLGLRYHDNLSKAEARRHAHSFILRLGLIEHINDRPAHIPPEKLKMALFCRELVVGPRIIILERPSYGLSRAELDYLLEATLSYQAESRCGLLIADDDADFFAHKYGFFVQELTGGRLAG
jgi:ABC-type transporter Mla maintaining outer membrane lipid asymmetry ATPase subunit MlaF